MAFDVPRDAILPVDAIDVRLDPGPHPYELANSAFVEESWARAVAENPALFDGRIALLAGLAYRDRRLEGRCHIVRYATFMHWRLTRPDSAGHAFAHAMLIASDGPLVAIRMGRHTANPGRVYFAAGSFEPEDFRADGCVDLEGNMHREVREETGLRLDPSMAEAGYHALSTPRGTVIVRRYFLPLTAAEAVRSIEAHVAAEADPEIEGPVLIRDVRDRPDGLMPHMERLVDWHFSGAGR